MPLDPNQLVVGEKLPDLEWILRGYLGQGGMGIVLDVEKPVGDSDEGEGLAGAVKIIKPELAWRPDHVAGFLTEARLLLKLEHPNIVRLLDVGCFRNGTPYMVMEKLTGGTLHALLRHYGPLPVAVACQIIFQANEALGHAHNDGILHEDFKLENAFVHSRGKNSKPVIKVLDFGIAAFRRHSQGVMGTPKYMSPEQLRGEKLSPQSDIFSSGLVYYLLVTGHMPYPVPESDVVAARLHMDPLPPSHWKPHLPKDLDRAVLWALARNPADRPGSCSEFSEALQPFEFFQEDGGEVNDTVPSLMTLTAVVQRATEAAAQGRGDTERSFSLPEVEGRSLEKAPSGLVSPEDCARESALVRKKFTLRMANAPPLPPGAMAGQGPSHPARPALPAAASPTPTDRVPAGPGLFPSVNSSAAGRPPVSVAAGPAAAWPSVIIEQSARYEGHALASSQRPSAVAVDRPAPQTLVPRTSPAVPAPIATPTPAGGRARSAGSVSATSRSVDPSGPRAEVVYSPVAAPNAWLRPSFLVPMGIMLALCAVLGILALKMGGPATSSEARLPPAPATVAPASAPLPAAATMPPLLGPPATGSVSAPPPSATASASASAASSVVRAVPPPPRSTSGRFSWGTPPPHAATPGTPATKSSSGTDDEWKLLYAPSEHQ